MTEGIAELILGLGMLTAMPILAIWAIIFVVGLIIGNDKGRNSCAYTLSLVFFGPIAVLVMLFLRPDQDVLNERAVNQKKKQWCPFCAKAISTQAIICIYCNSILAPLKVVRRLQSLRGEEEIGTLRMEVRRTFRPGPSPSNIRWAIQRHAAGASLIDIANRLNVNHVTVSQWIERYLTDDEWMCQIDTADAVRKQQEAERQST